MQAYTLYFILVILKLNVERCLGLSFKFSQKCDEVVVINGYVLI